MTPSFAAAGLPAAGSYGFDWLKNPSLIHCQVVSTQLIKQFKKCEVTDGSFAPVATQTPPLMATQIPPP
jgi:hypothetical protein